MCVVIHYGLSSAYKPAGLLVLTVAEDGTATGRLVNKTISFMPLRDQRVPRVTVDKVVRDTDVAEVSQTDLHASEVCNGEVQFAVGVRVPGCEWEYVPAIGEDGRHRVWFLDRTSRSWARFDYQPGARRWTVHQFGPRRLWDEVEAAHRWWEQAGRPPVDQWRFTITPHNQYVDLGTTTHPVEPAATRSTFRSLD